MASSHPNADLLVWIAWKIPDDALLENEDMN